MSVSSDNSSLASSLTDLMTSLAVIFVLLLVASLNNIGQERAQTRDQMIVQLQQALREFEPSGVKVERDGNDPLSLLVLLPKQALDEFAFNKADIPQKGREFLARFAPRLSKTVCSDRFKNEISSIIVEGHADSVGTDEANFNVSLQRSSAVVMESLNVLGRPENEDPIGSSTQDCFKRFISAAGRASYEPVRDNSTGHENKDASRRVIFKIRIRSIEQRGNLGEIIGGMGSATAK